MPLESQTWRIRIGLFNSTSSISASSKGAAPTKNMNYYVSTSILNCFDLFHKIWELVASLLVYICLLIIILAHLFIVLLPFLARTFQLRSNKYMLYFLPLWQLFTLQSELIILNAIFSLINRILLLRSGVEVNPGPTSRPPRLLSFATWNIDSIVAREGAKKSLVESIQSVYDFHLFGICETYLSDKILDEELLLDVFPEPPLRSDCKLTGRARGGVCLYYKDTIPLKRRPDLEMMDESIAVEIMLNRKKIIYLLSYRSPNQSPFEFDQYMSKLNQFIVKASSENPSTIILTGDFNARSPLLWNQETFQDNVGKTFSDFCTLNQFEQIIDEATHLPRDGVETCIDFILTNQPYLFVNKGVIPSPDPLCKHQIIHGKVNFNVPCPPPYKRKVWKYHLADITAIKHKIHTFDWETKLTDCPLDDSVKIFSEYILQIMETHIPNKVIKVDEADAPWITPQLKSLIRKGNTIHRNSVKNPNNSAAKEKDARYRTKTATAISEAKAQYIETLSNQICDPSTGQKAFWSAYKRLSNKKKITNIPPLFENGKYVSNFKEKTIIFNNYFAAQCKPFDIESHLPPFSPLTSNILSNVTFTVEAIIGIINKLNKKKAHGYDGISIAMLQLCPKEVARPLCIIFNRCLVNGVYPQMWKQANVQPVHKKNGRQDKTNYRPISLLPICGKIFEKIVFDSIYSFLLHNNLLSENQSGFRPGDSTINQLLAITTEIYNSFETLNETRAVFLDMSKAFDKVWHEALIFKMRKNGISGNLLNTLTNYLTNRKQRVVLNGIESPWEAIDSGVPQGSVLGPLLFLIYINDLTDNISANIKLFADDASLFIKVLQDTHMSDSNITRAHETLMADLTTITLWANTYKMKFNPDISKQAIEVVFSSKYNKGDHPLLSFNEIPVAREESTKHIGMVLDSKLSFRQHILEGIEKAKKGLSLMKFLSRFVNRKTLELTYTMHVRPHLEYGDILFHNCSSTLMNSLESIQYQAGIIATGCWQHTNRKKLYDELGWESLEDRRKFRRLSCYYKIINNLTPPYLRSYILDTQPGSSKSKRYKRTFFPDCYNEWEILDPSIKNSFNLNIFKSKLMKTLRPAKKGYFGITDRHGIKQISRLRVGHSDLRAHRFPKSFNCASPICSCGVENETVDHYLLRCSNFSGPRVLLTNAINSILPSSTLSVLNPNELVDILLYGSSTLIYSRSKALIQATIRFVKQSKRFKTLEAFSSLSEPV